jgi:hypothetical protein
MEALDQIYLAIKARSLARLDQDIEIFYPALKDLVELTGAINQNHEKVQTGLTFACYAYKLKAREAEVQLRIHQG